MIFSLNRDCFSWYMIRIYFYYHKKKICQIFPLVFLPLFSGWICVHSHAHRTHICDIHHLPTHASTKSTHHTKCVAIIAYILYVRDGERVYSAYMRMCTSRFAIAISYCHSLDVFFFILSASFLLLFFSSSSFSSFYSLVLLAYAIRPNISFFSLSLFLSVRG